MKKLLLIFLCAFTVACSSSDDDVKITEEIILGTWKPIAEVAICETGSTSTYRLTTCEQTSRFIFKEKNSYAYESYNDACEKNHTEQGHYIYENNVLKIENQTVAFFELSGNTMKIGTNELDEMEVCDDNKKTIVVYTEYVRL